MGTNEFDHHQGRRGLKKAHVPRAQQPSQTPTVVTSLQAAQMEAKEVDSSPVSLTSSIGQSFNTMPLPKNIPFNGALKEEADSNPGHSPSRPELIGVKNICIRKKNIHLEVFRDRVANVFSKDEENSGASESPYRVRTQDSERAELCSYSCTLPRSA